MDDYFVSYIFLTVCDLDTVQDRRDFSVVAGKVTDSAASEETDFNHLQTLHQLLRELDREQRLQGHKTSLSCGNAAPE